MEFACNWDEKLCEFWDSVLQKVQSNVSHGDLKSVKCRAHFKWSKKGKKLSVDSPQGVQLNSGQYCLRGEQALFVDLGPVLMMTSFLNLLILTTEIISPKNFTVTTVRAESRVYNIFRPSEMMVISWEKSFYSFVIIFFAFSDWNLTLAEWFFLFLIFRNFFDTVAFQTLVVNF